MLSIFLSHSPTLPHAQLRRGLVTQGYRIVSSAHTHYRVPQSENALHLRLADAKQLNPEGRTLLPKLAFNGFLTRFKTPDLSEGFQDVTSIDFKVRSGLIVAGSDGHKAEFLADASCDPPQFDGGPDELSVWRRYWT